LARPLILQFGIMCRQQCNISECGCEAPGGKFPCGEGSGAKGWCPTVNVKMQSDWCQMSERQCEQCGGAWCNAPSCSTAVVCPTTRKAGNPLLRSPTPTIVVTEVTPAPSTTPTLLPTSSPSLAFTPLPTLLDTEVAPVSKTFLEKYGIVGAFFGGLAIIAVCFAVFWARLHRQTLRTDRSLPTPFRELRKPLSPKEAKARLERIQLPCMPERSSATEVFRDDFDPMDVRSLSIKHRISLGVSVEADGFVTLQKPRPPSEDDALRETIPGQDPFNILIEAATGELLGPSLSFTSPSLPSRSSAKLIKSDTPDGRNGEPSLQDRQDCDETYSSVLFSVAREASRSKHKYVKIVTPSASRMGERDEYKSERKETAAFKPGEPSLGTPEGRLTVINVGKTMRLSPRLLSNASLTREEEGSCYPGESSPRK